MSDEWTPTTEDIRTSWYDDWFPSLSYAAFDRWLAAHDAEIRNAALEEAAVIVRNNFGRSWVAWESLGHLAAAIRAAKEDKR